MTIIKRNQRRALACLTTATLLLAANAAGAQDEEPKHSDAPEGFKPAEGEEGEDEEEKKKDGVEWSINAGATLNFTDNRQVIGQQDGSAFTFGFKMDAGVTVRDSGHEWRNTLGVLAGVTRTPALPEFVKTQDNLEAESIYLYHVTDWFGPYARFAWQTPMFRGTDVRAEPTDYTITNLDGTTTDVTASRLTLTDAMSPSRLKESIGLFAQPIRQEPVSVEVRLGAGGRHVLADGQLAVTDDEDTPVVEVSELDDVHQLGAEAALEIWGGFEEGRLTYKFTAEAMTPFLHNDLPAGDDRSSFELTNILLKAALSAKVVEWASVDYEFRAVREPQLLDAFQIQNQLLLTFGIGAAGGP